MSVFVERDEYRQVVYFAQLEVFGTAAGGDVDYTCAFFFAYGFPWYYSMRVAQRKEVCWAFRSSNGPE